MIKSKQGFFPVQWNQRQMSRKSVRNKTNQKELKTLKPNKGMEVTANKGSGVRATQIFEKGEFSLKMKKKFVK